MFKFEDIGCVNRDAVAGHPPGTLYVCQSDYAIAFAHDRNKIVCIADGKLYRVVDRKGHPLFPLADITVADLDGVKVSRVPNDDFAGIVPDDDPDAPRVVEG